VHAQFAYPPNGGRLPFTIAATHEIQNNSGLPRDLAIGVGGLMVRQTHWEGPLSGMRRRKFITALGAVTAMWPLWDGSGCVSPQIDLAEGPKKSEHLTSTRRRETRLSNPVWSTNYPNR